MPPLVLPAVRASVPRLLRRAVLCLTLLSHPVLCFSVRLLVRVIADRGAAYRAVADCG